MKYVLPGQDSVSRILAFFVVKNKSNSMHKSRKKKEEHELKQWTQEDIREAIESFYAQHHRYPRAGECKSKNGLPTYNTIRASIPDDCGRLFKNLLFSNSEGILNKGKRSTSNISIHSRKRRFPYVERLLLPEWASRLRNSV